MADVPSKMIYGTTQTVINTTDDIAAGNFSDAGNAFNNTVDSAVPYALYAEATISAPDWAAAPAAGTSIGLYGILQDFTSTGWDTQPPTGSSVNGARFFGSWPVAAADALQQRTIIISLLGCRIVGFYLLNGTAQNMNNDGGTPCVLRVTPFSIGATV